MFVKWNVQKRSLDETSENFTIIQTRWNEYRGGNCEVLKNLMTFYGM